MWCGDPKAVPKGISRGKVSSGTDLCNNWLESQLNVPVQLKLERVTLKGNSNP